MVRNLLLALVVLVGSACVGESPVLPTNCTMCKDLCVDFQVDPGHCGGCDTACTAGLVCVGGKCGVGQAYPSLLSPGGDEPALPVKRPQWPGGPAVYLIGTPFPATIYYRTDGGNPQKGQAGTRVAPSPVQIATTFSTGKPPDLEVRWYAEYELPDGSFRQEPRHRYVHTTDASVEATWGQRIQGGLQFAPNDGPSIAVSPGAPVHGKYLLQVWRDQPGSCGGWCAIRQTLWLEGVQIDCSDDPGAAYPGKPYNRTFDFTAPAAKGRYRVLSQVSLDNVCGAATLNDSAEVVGEVLVL